jgi:hypothetical protein
LKVAETKWRASNPEPEMSPAWIEWQAAYGGDGYDEADAAAKVANDKLGAAIDALRDTRARSLRGLFAKARLREIDPDSLGQFLTPSIIADLLALDAAHA